MTELFLCHELCELFFLRWYHSCIRLSTKQKALNELSTRTSVQCKSWTAHSVGAGFKKRSEYFTWGQSKGVFNYLNGSVENKKKLSPLILNLLAKSAEWQFWVPQFMRTLANCVSEEVKWKMTWSLILSIIRRTGMLYKIKKNISKCLKKEKTFKRCS